MSRPTRILIIDDDAPTRTMLRELVECAGPFTVLDAPDGASGVELARAIQPDLILLDINMPRRSGYEVCADLRGDPRTREVPVIVLSAAEESEAMTRALEAGADDFLSKPCSLEELRGKIRSISRLNRYRSLRQERERFRWLLDRSLEPLVIASPEGTVVFANARAREVLGLRDEPGADVVAVIERHFQCDPPNALAELRAGGLRPGRPFAVVQAETELVGARWFNVELQSAEAGTGEVLLKFTDRTGWVRRELETWSFQHMIQHKVRTPLNGLSNVLDLVALSPGIAGDPDAAALMKLAQDSARRLEDTLMSVLKFHQTLFRGAGVRDPADEPTALRGLVEAAGLEAGLSQVRVMSAPGEDQRTTLAAPLRTVFAEIADNYARFSTAAQDGLKVGIAATPAGDIEVSFFARGPVPSPEAISQMGRPYWQLQARFTGEVPGMGLGLATARLLLRSHGGDLRLSADEAGTGLITTVTLVSSASKHTSTPIHEAVPA